MTHTPSTSRQPLISSRIFVLLFFVVGFGALFGLLQWAHNLSSEQPVKAQERSGARITSAQNLSRIFKVNVPSFFKELVTMTALEVEGESIFGSEVTFENEVVFDGQMTLRNDLFANGVNIDVGSGEITASNILYSLEAGSGISISDGQNPTISATDLGSSQNIFKKIKVGSDTAEADENSDTLEVVAGSGITVSMDSVSDKLTISNAQTPGFIKTGTYALLADGVTRVGIGTSTPGNALEVNSGTADTSGFSFTQLTSSSPAGVGGGKVLSLDSGGRIILVADQTGGTPSAESVLPSATNGMTIYFNGTNWVASDNLFHDGGSVGISNAAPTSRLHVNTNHASKIGLIVQGYSSQTANLQEWRDSTNTILSYIDPNGVFNGQANVTGTINPGLTNGSVLFQGASGLTQDNANFFWDDSTNRLGIGTTTPRQELEVVGDLIVADGTSLNIYNPDVGGGAGTYIVGGGYHTLLNGEILGTNGGTGQIVIGGNVTANSSGSNFNMAIGYGSHVDGGVNGIAFGRNAYASGTDSLAIGKNASASADQIVIGSSDYTRTILAGGNVGIGTTTPGAKLTIRDTANATTLGASQGLQLYGATILGSRTEIGLGYADGTYAPGIIGFLNTDGTSNTAGDIYFGTRSVTTDTAVTERMRILANGNVGIGTTSPNSKLHVNGDIEQDSGFMMLNNAVRYSNAILSVRTGDAANQGIIVRANSPQTANLTEWQSSSGTVLSVVDEIGYLGLGISSPTEGLHLFDKNILLESTGTANTNYLAIRKGNSNYWRAGTFANTDFAIVNRASNFGRNDFVIQESTGNVGFGTSNPLSKLDISAPSAGARLLSTGVNSAELAFINGGATNFVVGKNTSGSFLINRGSYTGENPDITLSSTGLVGIGTDSPAYKLDVRGGIAANYNSGLTFFNGTLAHATIASNGNADLLFRTGTGTGIERMRIVYDGKVGIGTTIPGAKLDINGDLFAPTATFSANYAAGVPLTVKGGPSGTGNLTEWRNSSGTVLSVVDENGYLGVGTNNPSYLLHLTDNATLNNTPLAYISSTNDALVHLDSGGGVDDYSQIRFQKAGVTKGEIFTGDSTNDNFYIRGTGTSHLLLQSNGGNVGIGTTSPTNKLHIIGGAETVARFERTAESSQALEIAFGDIGAGNNASITTPGSLTLGIKTPNSALSNIDPVLAIAYTKNVGIGTIAPTSKLHVTGGYGANALATFNQLNSGDILTASASGTTRMVLSNAGNLGLGTAAPSSMLHILDSSGTNTNLTIENTNGGNSISPMITFKSSTTEAATIKWNNADQLFRFTSGRNGLGQFSFETQTGGSAVERLRITNAGNVGIGTNSPATRINTYGADANNQVGAGVNAAIRIGNTNGAVAGRISELQFANYAATPFAAVSGALLDGSSNSTGNLIFSTRNAAADANLTERMTILSTGNVGIGTNAPTAALDIVGKANFGDGNLALANQVGQVNIYDTAPALMFDYAAGYAANRRIVIKNNIDNGKSAHRLDFEVYDNTPALARTILSLESGTGNVGIGTTSPSSLLTVAGNIGVNSGNVLLNNTGNYLGNSTVNNYTPYITGAHGVLQSQNNLYLNIDTSNDDTTSSFIVAHNGTDAAGSELFRINSAGNVGIGTSAFGTNAAKVLGIAGSTAPTTSITDGIQLFAVDVAGSHELQVMDEAGNTTTLSPHNFSLIGSKSEDLAWSFYSQRNSLAINADMTKALRVVEKLSGEKLIYLKDLASGQMLEDESDATKITELADNGSIGEIAKWNYQLWTYIGEVIFEKPVQFLAQVTFNGKAIFTADAWFGSRVTFADKDMAGFATITPGNTRVTVSFENPFAQRPVVTVTPKSAVKLDWFRVTEESLTSFVIEISGAQAEDVVFSWTALAVEQAGSVVTSPATTTQPTSSPTAQPSAPEPTPLSSPVPTIEPSLVSTSSAEVIPTPVALETVEPATSSATTP